MRVEGILKHDSATGHGVVIQFEHHEVHDGAMHCLCRSNAALGNGSSDELRVAVGAKELHVTFMMAAGGDGTGYLYETTTKTANTAVTPYCMNRNYENTLLTTATHTPGGSGDGTNLWTEFLPGGAGPKAGGGQVRQGTEWVLKPDTVYLFRFTNSAGSTKPYTFCGEMYEK